VWWCVVIAPVSLAFVVCPTLVAVSRRYLGINLSQWLYVLRVAFPLVAVIGVAGLFVSVEQWRTVMSWTGQGRTAERAPEVWSALLRVRLVLTRAMLICCPFAPVAIVWLVVHAHKPTWAAVPLLFVAFAGILSLWSVVVPLSEMIIRPMVEEVAAFLPTDFEPPTGLTLRKKALAPLPVVTLMAALIEGAYASLSHVGAVRLGIAIGVGLASIGVATAIFWLGTQTLISPIDHLMTATKRVRAGDLDTPVPIVTTDELGQLAHSFNQMLEGLREREALLVDKAELTTALRGSLARIVTAADAERRRVERDLHDGAQQRLVLLKLKLSSLERQIGDNALLAEIAGDAEAALSELRDLARGLYPPLLESEGLPAALGETATRAAIPTTVTAEGTGRYPAELEAAVYFCCLEALQNAAKHAGPGASARVSLMADDTELRFEVTDTGLGFDPQQVNGSSGLQNMTDRIGALGGTLTVTSSPGAGTTVAAVIPASPQC
jgi:signal transduction histidine kinase